MPLKNIPWLIREIRRNEPESHQTASQCPESRYRLGAVEGFAANRLGSRGAGAAPVIGRTFHLPSKDPKSRIPSAGRPARSRVGIHGHATPPATPTGWRRPEGSQIPRLKVCFAFRSYAPKTGRFLGGPRRDKSNRLISQAAGVRPS